MKGDYTRFTHDPSKHFTGVLRQQGRLDLDADWNEHVQIVERLERLEAVDVIGRSGRPKRGNGFDVTVRADGDLLLEEGHVYVDGTMVENEPARVPVSFTSDTVVSVPEQAIADGTFRLGQPVWAAAAGVAAAATHIAAIAATSTAGTRAVTLAAGLPAILAASGQTLRPRASYRFQPSLPAPGALNPVVDQRDLIYLDVWQRHVTVLEDGSIAEPALRGPDTTTRLQTVWQLRVERVTPTTTCEQARTLLAGRPGRGDGRLTTVAATAPPVDDPCYPAPTSGGGAIDNRLYRVEVHQLASTSSVPPRPNPTFKWSRDNGSVAYQAAELVAGEPTKVKLERLGRDQVLALAAGDWVEIMGDEDELSGAAGLIAKVAAPPDAARRIITLDRDVSAYGGRRHLKLRRWDRGVATEALRQADGTLQTLDAGVQVRMGAGNLRVGDWWTFTTRAAGQPPVQRLTDEPPQGVVHAYAPIALVTWTGTTADWSTSVVTDCRPRFPALTEICAEDVCVDDAGCVSGATTVQEALDNLCRQRTLHHAGGDGQEALPGRLLPGFLEAGVEDGMGRRVASAQVTFTVVTPAGTPPGAVSQPPGGASVPTDGAGVAWASEITVSTDASGVARCQWRLGGNRRALNEVRARLTAAPTGAPLGPPRPLFFRALSEATVLALRHVGGGGQHGPPGQRLPCAVIVGVEDEEGRPRAGASVRFDVAAGAVQEEPASGAPATSITVPTRADGTAHVRWDLGPSEGCQRLTATLQGPPQGAGLVCVFEAQAHEPANGKGLCTITVEPGQSLQGAVDALPESGGRICLTAGIHELESVVRVEKRRRVLMLGAGDATLLRGEREIAIEFTNCVEVEVRDLRILVGRGPAGGGETRLDGALSFVDCLGVRVNGCSIGCPGSFDRRQACLAVRSGEGAGCDRVVVERNRFEAGAWQIGVLAIDAGRLAVRQNTIRLAGEKADKIPTDSFVSPEVARLIRKTSHVNDPVRVERVLHGRSFTVDEEGFIRPLIEDFGRLAPLWLTLSDDPVAAATEWIEMLMAQQPDAYPRSALSELGAEVLDVLEQDPGDWHDEVPRGIPGPPGKQFDVLDTAYRFSYASELSAELVLTFSENAPIEAIRPHRTIDEAVADWVREVAAGAPGAGDEVVQPLVDAFQVVGQGIVVAGRRADTVSICDNLIEDVVQGIHVGVKRPLRFPTPMAGFEDRSGVHELVVDRNVIHAAVPATLERDRHGIFVGDSLSVQITGTVGTLERPGRDFTGARADMESAVEGIRVYGWLGPFLAIRHTSLTGFRPVGIRVVPRNAPPSEGNQRPMWFVGETMAWGAGLALEAPGVVERERDYVL